MMPFPYVLLLVYLVTLDAAAQDVRERSNLGLVQRQITSIEQLADRARSSATDAHKARYHFDYLRFAADIARVRQGIDKYLSPSRAQPADQAELTGDYRTEAPHSSPSNEHD